MRDASSDPDPAPAPVAAAGADEALLASRARVVAASHAQRRRIELELHDGVQQDLVALAVNLQLVQGLMDVDPAGARELLEAMRGDIQAALDNVRALSNDVYPPLLTDRGLAESLAALGPAVGVAVRVEAGMLGRYPPEVEAAVYFCCVDAVKNVAADAGIGVRATISAWREPAALHFTVTDDGAAAEPATNAIGAGVLGMRDRVEAVGGWLAVHSSPGQGTTVAGTIPLGPDEDR
jgi:signal transduction histidine kinase